VTVSGLPLLDLFNRLREADLPLGIEEYELMPRALGAGFGFEGVDSLKRLCSLLWIKSADEQVVFNHVFEEFLQERRSDAAAFEQERAPAPEGEEPAPVEDENETAPRSKPDEVKTKRISLDSKRTRDDSEREQGDDSARRALPGRQRLKREPSRGAKLSGEITIAIGDEAAQYMMPRLGQARGEAAERRYRFASDYLPITQRQMKQNWRHLRKSVREGPAVELDLQASVNKVANEGRLYEVVLRPRRINRASMVLLVDWEGSMVPFHSFSRRLEQTAMRGGRLGQTNIYYFNNFPLDTLYCNPYFSESLSVNSVTASLHPTRTAVMIFSDAGAARNRYSYDRVEKTRAFLRRLYQSVRYVAWLNPMPVDRWPNTSAAAIARSVPMFDVSRRGMQDAISVLRGRIVPRR